ncbi:hypothetical protein HYY71_01470 [Candidatus Woesearchaeota archaeon]|nr:hypothetical protein [Candidatus Woesearchaeota archaeon]
MARTDIERYIGELKGSVESGKSQDLYSLKKELMKLNEASAAFENFERESTIIGKELVRDAQDLSLLVKIRNLALQIKNKKRINDNLHSLHFNLNIIKNSGDERAIKSALGAFLNNNDTCVNSMIYELNDFKAKLEDVQNYHSILLPQSLDNRLRTDEKYKRHIERLNAIHKKQKDAFASTVMLFLKFARKRMKSLQKFK